MDQQIGAEQETQDVAAPAQNADAIGKPQSSRLGTEQLRIIVTDGDQSATTWQDLAAGRRAPSDCGPAPWS
jgi:hypothetical protein